MEVSDISLSSDWDIVNTNFTTSLEDDNVEELPKEPAPNNEPTNMENEERKGSCVDDLQDDVCDSNSSSDVDVIDDIENESKTYLKNAKIHPMDFSISSSLEESTTCVPPPTEVTSKVVPAPKTENRYVFLNLQLDLLDWTNIVSKLKEHYLWLIFSFVMTTVLVYMGSPTEDNIKKMIAQVNALKAENTDLKNKVLSKIEDDKLFLTFEEQITTLKDENFKLSSSLQSLILQLEQQTDLFRKENQLRKKDFYKSEIENLKEQVNMLKIDNDDLQKQLVRMRYSMYSTHPEEPKKQADDKKEKVGLNEDKNDSASEILTEEIKDLKKKLYSEVEKLKDWKESINHIVKKLGNHPFNEKPESYTDDDDRFNHKRSDEDRPKKDKGKKFYNWSWKDLKKNFRGTLDSLPNINMSHILSMTVDQKKVEGVFESVGHYFKKAQEKTKKILNFDEDVKNDFWNALGDLRKKWDSAKAEFFENTYKKASFYESGESQPTDDTRKSDHYEGGKTAKQFYDDKQHDNKDQKTESVDALKENSKYKSKPADQPLNSWVFERAAYRSEERDNVQQDDETTNWFLRKKHLDDEESPSPPK